ncbi:hypothetical protein AAMO2058_000280700 [Amorphochlora amoebiformis]
MRFRACLRHEMVPPTCLSTTGEGSVVSTFLTPLLNPKNLSEVEHAEFALHEGYGTTYRQLTMWSRPGHGDRKILGGLPRMTPQVALKYAKRSFRAVELWNEENNDRKHYMMSEFTRVCGIHRGLICELLVTESAMHPAQAEMQIDKGMEDLELYCDTLLEPSNTNDTGGGLVVESAETGEEVWDAFKHIVDGKALLLSPPPYQNFCSIALKLIMEYVDCPPGLLVLMITESESDKNELLSALDTLEYVSRPTKLR